MKQKICFPFFGDTLGGSHLSSLLIINNLKKKGINPLIILHKKGKFFSVLKKKKIKFIFYPLNFFFGSSKNKYLNLLYILISLPFITYLIYRYKIGIIHSNDMKVHLNWILPTIILKKKFIWHQRTILPKSRIVNLLIKCSSKIICISKFVRNSIPNYLDHKIKIINNSISIKNKKIKFKFLRKELSKDPKQKLVGVFGNIQKIKQPEILIEIAEIIKKNDLNIKICSFGYDKEGLLKHLKKKINEKKLNNYIKFFNFKYPIEPWILNMNIILASSLSDGFGRTIIEAMFLKKPVIASKAGGHLELIKNNINGILVKKDDSNEYFLAIVKLLKNNVFYKNIVKNGYESCSKFSQEKNLEILSKIYE